MRADKFCGWHHNPRGVEAWLDHPDNRHPLFGSAASNLKASKKTVLLWQPLLSLIPGWTRGAQGIGDCVGWAMALAVSCLMAARIVAKGKKEHFPGEAATEPLYGGSRVEALGKDRGGRSDGSYGAAAAKWLKDWGVIVRRDYSAETGNPEHDLRTYSAKKAKEWGDYGCGGEHDKDKLDKVARLHPVKTTSLVTSFDEAARAIGNWYPVPVCSNQGLSAKRDSDGFSAPRGTWAHAMVFIGVRHGPRPGLLCGNSWAHYYSGPKWPDFEPDEIARSCTWVDAEVCDQMLGRWRDSFALSHLDGFEPQTLPDFGTEDFL